MITEARINENRKSRYYREGLWTEKTILDVWEAQAAACWSDTYVTDSKGSSFTYGEVDESASKLAFWLIDQGIEPGDVVSFQMPTWAEFCIVYVACLKAGAVMHPLSIDRRRRSVVQNMNQVASRAYIGPTLFESTDFESLALDARHEVPSLRCLLFVDRLAPVQRGTALSAVLQDVGRTPGRPEVSSDDVACILSTSGSTGKPKAAMLTHNNILFSETSFIAGAGRTKQDVMYMPSPLNHATGFFHGLLSPMILGGRAVLQERFDVEEAVDLVNAERCTWSMGATPFIFDLLNELDRTGKKLESLELFLCGGAPVPGSLVQRAWKHGVLLCEVYGSTESCPHVYVPPANCLAWNGSWSGIPYPGIEVRVVDEHRNEVPRGTQGEEASRGPHQFVGYLGDPERTDKALDDEGWFYSGDLCYQDEQGRIRINGRKKEIIIRGGENISAVEVDHLVDGCPGIGDHAAIGMPDERLGEVVCLFAVSENGRCATLAEVRDYMRAQEAHEHLLPVRLEFVDEIPHTATGKTRRFLLVEELKRRMEREVRS